MLLLDDSSILSLFQMFNRNAEHRHGDAEPVIQPSLRTWKRLLL